jgi:MFS family permease
LIKTVSTTLRTILVTIGKKNVTPPRRITRSPGNFPKNGLVLTKFYHIPNSSVGLYLIPFAIGNFFGPLLLGRLFDTIGRRAMISFTYIVPGVLLTITGWLFVQGILNAMTQTICWSIIF